MKQSANFQVKNKFLSIKNTQTIHISLLFLKYSWLVLNKLIYFCHMEFLPTMEKQIWLLYCVVFFNHFKLIIFIFIH